MIIHIRPLYKIAFVLLLGPLFGNAQPLIEEDLVKFTQGIPTVPLSVTELHTMHTVQTRFGEKFGQAIPLGSMHDQTKKWIGILLNDTIRKVMQRNRRYDLSEEAQFEDIRLKMISRPFMVNPLLKTTRLTDSSSKTIFLQLASLEKIFHWEPYMNSLKKIQRNEMEQQTLTRLKLNEAEAKLPEVQTENGPQKDPDKLMRITDQYATKKWQNDLLFYQEKAKNWNNYFQHYSKGVEILQSVLNITAFGKKIPGVNTSLLLKAISDVLTRAIEVIGMMIWEQLILIETGETVYQSQKILNQSVTEK